MLIKEVMNGTYGDNLLESNNHIYQPVLSIFPWTFPIQFFPKSGSFFPLEIIHFRVIIEILYLL